MKNIVCLFATLSLFSCTKQYVTNNTYTSPVPPSVEHRENLNGDTIRFTKASYVMYSLQDALFNTVFLDSTKAVPGTTVVLYSFAQAESKVAFNTGIFETGGSSLTAHTAQAWTMTITYADSNRFFISLVN